MVFVGISWEIDHFIENCQNLAKFYNFAILDTRVLGARAYCFYQWLAWILSAGSTPITACHSYIPVRRKQNITKTWTSKLFAQNSNSYFKNYSANIDLLVFILMHFHVKSKYGYGIWIWFFFVEKTWKISVSRQHTTFV